MATPSSINGNVINTRRAARGTSSVYCAAAWCNNFGGCRVDEPLSFFRFPKESSKAKEWAKFCLREDLLWREGSLNNYRLCSEHFKEEDYRQTYPRRLLKSEATPSISHSCHRTIKDSNGNDEMCHDLEDPSKDQCTLKDIEIGDELNNSTLGDHLEMAAVLSGDMVIPDELTSRTLRAWPSGEDTLLLNPTLSLRQDPSSSDQVSFEDWDIDNNIKADPDIEHEGEMNNDVHSPEIVAPCDENEATNFGAEGINAMREILAGSVQENSLVMFFAKAFQVVCSLPEELQNQVKKDMLDSIVRAERQCDQTGSSVHI